jgi:UDPglucose 6-dehydrogenase
MREAPAIEIVNTLLSKGAKVKAYDPKAVDEAKKIFGDTIEYTSSNYEALQGAAALIIATEWNEFRRPDFDKVKNLLKEPIIFDGRNLFEPNRMLRRGFSYFNIGKTSKCPEKIEI